MLLRLVFELADTLLALNIADRRHFGDINSCIKQEREAGEEGSRRQQGRHKKKRNEEGQVDWQQQKHAAESENAFGLHFLSAATCRSARNLIYAAGSRHATCCTTTTKATTTTTKMMQQQQPGNIFIKNQQRTTTNDACFMTLIVIYAN